MRDIFLSKNPRVLNQRIKLVNLENEKIFLLGVKDSWLHCVNFDGAQITTAVFMNSFIDNCYISGAKLNEVQFINCVLSDNMFFDTEFNTVIFENCKLGWNSFRSAIWNDIEFKDSSIAFNGFFDLTLSSVKGLEIYKSLDSKNQSLIYVPSLKSFYHRRFSGRWDKVIKFLKQIPPRFIEYNYRQELLFMVEDMCQKYGGIKGNF